jgi:hypothetical protein
MATEREKPRVDKKGQIVTFKDCKNAVHEAISSMSKTLAEDGPIKNSQTLSIVYQRHIDVLEVVREKFDMLHKVSKKAQRKTVHMEKLREMGFEIIIYTTRTNPNVNPGYTKYQLAAKVEKVLRKHSIPFDKIELGGKPIARYYIDDRALTFLDSWEDMLCTIEELEKAG